MAGPATRRIGNGEDNLRMGPAVVIAARYSKRVVVFPSRPYRPTNLKWIADHQMIDLSNSLAQSIPLSQPSR